METREIRRQWEGAAPGWAKWEGTIAEWLRPVTEAMLDLAGVAPGHRVLDVACGAGSQTLSAARRVGRGGQVVASDISETMLRFVADNARAAGLDNVTTRVGAAEELEVEAGHFDAVICRLGLMLFARPAEALAAMTRALAPGGRVAVVVFTTPQSNPFMARPMQVLLRHAGKEPPLPGQPGIFSLGAAGALEQLFESAGLVAFERRELRVPFRLSSASEALAMMQEAFGAYRAVVSDCEESVRQAAWSEVARVLSSFAGKAGFETLAEVAVAAARKAD